MSQMHVDPATGRRYYVDPQTGQSRWADEVAVRTPNAVVPARPAPAPVYAHAGGYSAVITPRSPTGPCVLSFIGGIFGFPGIGSFAAGAPGNAIGVLIAGWVSILLMFVLIGFVLYPLVWLGGVLVAYYDVQRWNRRQGFVSA